MSLKSIFLLSFLLVPFVGHSTESLPFSTTVATNELAPQIHTLDGIVEADDHYGVLVDVTSGRERFVFPLCDLNVRDRKSANYMPVKDYCVWFANR